MQNTDLQAEFLPDLREYIAGRNIRIVGYRTKPISVKETLGEGGEAEEGTRTFQRAEPSDMEEASSSFDLSSLFVDFLQASNEEDQMTASQEAYYDSKRC